MTITRNRRQRGLSASVAGLGLAVALVVLPGTDPATAIESTAAPDVKTEVTKATSAVARAVQRVQAHDYGAARKALGTAALHTRRANVQAASLIGAPPTDPESDDPPGPPAVLAALKLDGRVGTQLVPLFDGTDRSRLLASLRTTIRVAQVRRSVVLDQVLALPAEGDGADYADGLTDTLPSYTREVATFADALDAFDLTPEARSTLTAALGRARVAAQRMTSAYGGGERPAS
jgi:hypothetical protein